MTIFAPATKLDRMNKAPYSRSRLAALFAAVFLISAAYLALLGSYPFALGGTREYEWPVLFHGVASRLPAALLITLLCAVALALLGRDMGALFNAKAGRARLFAALFLLGVGLQAGPAAVHKQGLLEFPLRVYLADHTSYFADAARIQDPSKWLDDYLPRFEKLSVMLDKVKSGRQSDEELREIWSEADKIFHTHTRTHPPGAVLAFYAAQEAVRLMPGFADFYVRAVPRSREAAAKFGLSDYQVAAGGVCALLLFIFAAACLPLSFALARQVLSDEKALAAAALFGTSPAFSHKTPVLNHALAFVVLFCLWLFITGLAKRQWWKAVLAGALSGLALWAGTSVVAVFPLCAVFAGAWLWGRRSRAGEEGAVLKADAGRAVLFFLLVAASAALLCLGLGLVLETSYIRVYKAITGTGWEFNNLASQRQNVFLWISFNFYEMLAFAGVPLAFFFIGSTGKNVLALFRKKADDQTRYALAVIVFLLALNLSGKVCYEASRLVWFGFPLMAIIAVQAMPAPRNGLSDAENNRAAWFLAGVFAVQTACAVAFRSIF